jgi:hypothetical protein
MRLTPVGPALLPRTWLTGRDTQVIGLRALTMASAQAGASLYHGCKDCGSDGSLPKKAVSVTKSSREI